jgi:hypothetical protein
MTNIRNVRKQLITKQDLALGKGKVIQRRGDENKELDKLDLVMGVSAVADLSGLVGEYEDQRVSVKGYHAGSAVGGGIFYWDSSRAAENNGGTVFDGWVRLFDGAYNVTWFGAVGNNSHDSTAAINALLSVIPSGSTVEFTSGNYVTTSVLVLPPTTMGVVFQGNGAIIRANHNGDGLDITSINENFSRHKLYNLNIVGPNKSFPLNAAELAGTSTGAGLKIGRDDGDITATGYVISVNGCTFSNFHKGIYLQNALLCGFTDCYATFNKYGLYVDSGQTNANNFTNCSFRLNSNAGIYFPNRMEGNLTRATSNTFFGCEIESNIPYNAETGGYPSVHDTTGNTGVGVYISNSYDNIFTGCYSENHDFAVYITGSADDNRFTDCRFAQGGSGAIRKDSIKITNGFCNNNTFTGCKMSATYTEPNVFLPSELSYNVFATCVGFNFTNSEVLSSATRVENATAAAGLVAETTYASLNIAPQGRAINLTPGTGRGRINGIGTANATLNCLGLSEVVLGDQISGPTTINAFSNFRTGQFLFVVNHQESHTVIIETTYARKTMLKFGDSVLLYKNALGNILQFNQDTRESLSASWTPVVKTSGGAVISLSSGTGVYQLNGRTLTLWFSVAFTSRTDSYYDIDIPFVSSALEGIVGQCGFGSNGYTVRTLSGNRIRCNVSDTTTGFSGVATVLF